jgi:D-alanine-D-alanine ligase
MAGLPVADWLTLAPGEKPDASAIIARLGLPLVVKPVRDGSSLGMSIAKDAAALSAGIDRAGGSRRTVMVERFIPGRELTVGVIGNDQIEALPVIEIVPGGQYEFFDYEAKYQPGASEEICPAQVSDAIRDQAQEYAIRAHKVLRLSGYSRTDMRLDPDNNFYLLETNTIPGMTATSLLPRMAAVHGLTFSDFLEKLIRLGMERTQQLA